MRELRVLACVKPALTVRGHNWKRRTANSSAVRHALEERVKELNCLYGIAGLIDRCGGSIEKLLCGIVELLPDSWQYPDIACARIALEGREYKTANFRPSRWRQTANIRVAGEAAGVVEVCYLRRRPKHDEGPFLKEERLLICAIAERLGKAIDRIRAERQLEVERESLRNMNIALREVIAQVQEEKTGLKRAMQANTDKIVIPILDALQGVVPTEQRQYVTLLRRNLEEITSPFADRVSREFMSLTATEIGICDMLRRGLSTKEIAQLRGISQSTVSRHREHIRRKLGLTNEPINLVTYLHTFMMEEQAKEDRRTEEIYNGSRNLGPGGAAGRTGSAACAGGGDGGREKRCQMERVSEWNGTAADLGCCGRRTSASRRRRT